MAGQAGRITARDLRNVPRYVLRTVAVLMLVCGLLSLWGLHGDGKMPGMSPLSGLNPYRISSAYCVWSAADAQARWAGLSPALDILDRVNPAVAHWLRDKHAHGLVVFGDQCRAGGDPEPAVARYEILRGRVVVSRELFCENDGTIAVTLCHEYRHSRQNLGKFCQHVLSFLVVRGGDASIIENDAVLYEHEARTAIFGGGRSRERELAAWQAAVQPQGQAGRDRFTSP